MRIGIASDHGGFELKAYLSTALKGAGHEVVDFGAKELVAEDDYPDFVIPMARAVASGEVTRGLAICDSGVGACIAANKVPGVRAAALGAAVPSRCGTAIERRGPPGVARPGSTLAGSGGKCGAFSAGSS